MFYWRFIVVHLIVGIWIWETTKTNLQYCELKYYIFVFLPRLDTEFIQIIYL